MQTQRSEEIRRWGETIRLGPGRFLQLVALRPSSAPRCVWVRDLDRVAAFAERATELGADCHYGVLPRSRMSGRASAVQARDALHADLDVGKPGSHASLQDALAVVRAFPVPPTTLIASGGGLHARYQLHDDLSHSDWLRLEAALTRALVADEAAADVGRLHRIPGTWNLKTGSMRPVHLLEVGPPSSAEEIEAAVIESPRAATSVPASSPTPLPAVRHGERRPYRHDGRPFDVANDVPVREVLAALGVTFFSSEGTRTHCGCPVCPGPDLREMVVGGRANVATCFGTCRRSYTAVDLVVAVRRVQPRAAVDWLCEHFAVPGFPGRWNTS